MTSDRQVDLLAIPTHGKHDRNAGPDGHVAAHIIEGFDRRAVKRQQEIALPDAGRLGGTARVDAGDDRIGDIFTVAEEDPGKDDDGQQKIGDRAGGDGRSTLPQFRAHEGLFALGGWNILQRVEVGSAGGVGVAIESHIAAQRHGGDLPARPVPVGKTDQFGAEAEGKGQDLDAAPASNEIMAHFVNEDDQ